MAAGHHTEHDHPWQEGTRLPPTHHTPTSPNLTVELDWLVVDGVPECDGVHITSATGQPITAGDLRDLNLPKLMRQIRAGIVAEKATPPSRGVIRRSAQERLEEVAKVYRQAFTAGQRPAKAVAERLNLPRGTASRLISDARKAGLLPPTSPGAPQG